MIKIKYKPSAAIFNKVVAVQKKINKVNMVYEVIDVAKFNRKLQQLNFDIRKVILKSI